MVTLIAINAVRTGRWAAHYTRECECGCTKTRNILIIEQTKKPSDIKAKKLINEHHDK